MATSPSSSSSVRPSPATLREVATWAASLHQLAANHHHLLLYSTTMTSEKTQHLIEHAETPRIKLNDGRSIPVLGFGTSRIPLDETPGQINRAIELGFSHIDSAQSYGNEAEAGQGIRDSGLARDEIWVTSKWSGRDGKGIRQSAEESLEKFGLKYLDLYLIHQPGLTDDIPAAWAEFEKLQADGLVKSIGVSNFEIEDLEILLKHAKVKPAVNQIYFHPYVYKFKAPLIEYLAENDIAFEAFSGLMPLRSPPGGPLDKPLAEISKRLDIAPEQVLLAWILAHSGIAVTKSSNDDRIRRYLAVPSIRLTKEDVAAIDKAGIEGESRGRTIWWIKRASAATLFGLVGASLVRRVLGL